MRKHAMRSSRQSPADSAIACLYSVVDRFNAEDPFWSSLSPEPGSAVVQDGRFRVVVNGQGARIVVQGVMMVQAATPDLVTPVIDVGGLPNRSGLVPSQWHRVVCSVDDRGRFVTSNFRTAIESAIRDAQSA